MKWTSAIIAVSVLLVMLATVHGDVQKRDVTSDEAVGATGGEEEHIGPPDADQEWGDDSGDAHVEIDDDVEEEEEGEMEDPNMAEDVFQDSSFLARRKGRQRRPKITTTPASRPQARQYQQTSGEPLTRDQQQDRLLAALTRQLMLQQLAMEERVRSEGSSGIKQIRVNTDGERPYDAAHHAGKSIASMHEHANNVRTVGLGEFIAVLNGVEFRTRHNDYRLYMPSSDGEYHKTVNVPFPPVPPRVTSKATVEEQIDEMRLWFKAWQDQDHSVRDYRKYFRPVLCYLEGAWTITGDKVDEAFNSDRHFIDAATWFELQEKIRYTSYTGRKDALENFSYLPTTIVDIGDNNNPIFAQWNYRILCHPLKDDLPLSKLKLVDDLAPRMNNRYTYDAYRQSRAARFQVWDDKTSPRYTLLDKLMSEIPGKDGYGANIVDDAMGATAIDLNPDNRANQPVNAAYYHRTYKVDKAGAMGLVVRIRGFSDRNLYVALTTQDKVAPMNITHCTGRRRNKVCTEITQRVSYAIPMEIIYTTPLSNWNPYNIKYKGSYNTADARTVTALNENGDRRNGKLTPDRAFNGTHSKLFYMTPADFFKRGRAGGDDPADTTRFAVGVLDQNGVMRKMRAAGHRIMFPQIEGVGDKIRQRYPIMPVHGEGGPVWKELEALKDIVMEMSTHYDMYRQPPLGGAPISTTPAPVLYTFTTTVSHKEGVSPHQHTFTISAGQAGRLKAGSLGRVIVTTSTNMGHEHELLVKYDASQGGYYIRRCDGFWSGCMDGHEKRLFCTQASGDDCP